MKQEKIYCGSGKIVPTQYGDLTKISFHKEDINKLVKYLQENGGDWINLVLKEKKEPQEGKPTHYLEVDTWKPQEGYKSEHTKPITTTPVTDEMVKENSIKDSGLPF